jgi:addiction module HigA family antidote
MPTASTWSSTIEREEFPVTERLAGPPTHPGELLREIVTEGLGLSVAEAARRLGVSRMTLHRVLGGGQSVTPGMALCLGKLCGNGLELWLACRWLTISGTWSEPCVPSSSASRPTGRRDVYRRSDRSWHLGDGMELIPAGGEILMAREAITAGEYTYATCFSLGRPQNAAPWCHRRSAFVRLEEESSGKR